MFLPRWSRPLLASALMLAGCKLNPSADSSPPAATAPNKPAAAPAAAPARASGPTLSYLKPAGADRCAWTLQPLPSGEAATVFTLDAACDVSQLFWSTVRKEGLVLSRPSAGAAPRVWRLDAAAKSGQAMSLKGLPFGTGEQRPYKATLHQVGFDAQGRPVALVSASFERAAVKEGAVSYEGENIPVKGGGAPVLAMAYRWEGAEWKRFETKTLSGAGENSDAGIGTLDATRALVVAKTPATDLLPGEDAAESVVRKLDAAAPGLEGDGKWRAVTTPGGPLYYRAVEEQGDTFAAGPLRWEQEGKLVEPEGLGVRDGALIQLQVRGELVLVFVVDADPRAAHVLDSRTKKKVVSVTDVKDPTLLPE
jgi:hypothetical protein